jgi:hypothetical protein
MDTQPVQPAQKTSRLAITSLVLGVLSLFMFALSWFGAYGLIASMDALPIWFVLIYGGRSGEGLIGIASLICGIIALVQIKKHDGRENGIGMAITGIVLGSIECAVFLFLITIFIIGSR